jgi:N-acetylglutamate synthase-like GNAT family acetyltransferase
MTAPGKEYRIRQGKLDDLPNLRDIELAADRLFPPGRVPETGATFPLPQLEAAVHNELLLIAEAAGGVVGFAVSAVCDRLLHLSLLAVHPDHGRRGLGTNLVLRVVEEARGRALAGVTLTTFADLKWNAPFYEKLGFHILAPDEWSPRLASLLTKEKEAGMNNRVAMLKTL